MLEDKRKFMRFSVPLVLEFKPTQGSSEYSWGLTRNFSYEGFCFESQSMDFELRKDLEFKLNIPRSYTPVSVIGNVVWIKQHEDNCLAGVKFKETDKKVKSNLLEKICDYGNVSFDMFVYDKRPESVMTEKETKKSPAKVRKEQKQAKKSPKVPDIITIKKQYLKSRPVCNVTFRLPKEAAPEAQGVTIVGEFNNWNTTETPLKRTENGDFTITLELPCNAEYRFRYLIDGTRWENDWCADRYIPNNFGCDDSVVVV